MSNRLQPPSQLHESPSGEGFASAPPYAPDEAPCAGDAGVSPDFNTSAEERRRANQRDQIVDFAVNTGEELRPDLPAGFDLGEPLPPEIDAEEPVHDMLEPLIYLSFDEFTMDATGLSAEIVTRRAMNTVLVSSPFEVRSRVRNEAGTGWSKFIRHRDPDGRVHEYAVPDAALHGDLANLAGDLAAQGLTIAREHRALLAKYLLRVDTERRVTRVLRSGWHEIRGARCFVLPELVIGGPPGETVALEGGAGLYERKGTLEDWSMGVGQLVAGHARGVLAVSTAFAGPLLELLGCEGGGIHLVGASSTGKTTLLRAVASVWGRGASDPGFIRTWRATANAQEGAAALNTDTLLALDEINVAEPKDAAAAIYQLAAGVGKGRMTRTGALRASQTWRIMVLSTGEVSIGTKIAEERGRRAHAGQEVRLINIPADAGCGFGAFDGIGSEGDAGKLADAIRQAASGVYGVAGPAFVKRLLEDEPQDVREAVGEMVDNFIADHLPANADGQVKRAAERLGLIGAAGELAIEWEIVPWRAGMAIGAAARALADWIAVRGGVSAAEEREAVAQVRRFIEAHGEARFESLSAASDEAGSLESPRVLNRAGYRKGSGVNRRWFVFPEVWKSEVCEGLDPTATARVLAAKGMLIPDSGGGKFLRSERTPHGTKRVYVLTSTILDGGFDDS